MDIFLAEGLTKGKAQPEDDERITQKIVTLREAEKLDSLGQDLRFEIHRGNFVLCAVRGRLSVTLTLGTWRSGDGK